MNKLCFILFCLGAFTIKAQQIPMYNHDFINPFSMNPAYAGYQEDMKAYIVRNTRNSTFNGGSVNNYLTVDGGIFNGKFGLGLAAFYQTHGLLKQSGGSISYAYHLKINENQRLSFGVSAGVLDNKIDVDGFNVQDYNDPYLTGLRQDKVVFNASAGLVYKLKGFRLGISVPQLIGSKVKYASSNSIGYYQMARHYMANATYEFVLSKQHQITLSPFATARYLPGAKFQYDGTLMLDFKKFGWIAAGYRSDYAVQFNAGVRIARSLSVGYSYELLIGSMKKYSTGMHHEVLIGYTLNLDKFRNKIKTLEDENLAKQNSLDSTNAENRVQIAKNKALMDSLDRLKEQNKFLNDRLADIENNARRDTVDASDFKKSDGYKIVELDDSDSPDGYYVVTGVFKFKNNAESHKENCLEKGFSKTYIVKNQKNKYYYVVILHSKDKDQAINVLMEYRAHAEKAKTWILDYTQIQK